MEDQKQAITVVEMEDAIRRSGYLLERRVGAVFQLAASMLIATLLTLIRSPESLENSTFQHTQRSICLVVQGRSTSSVFLSAASVRITISLWPSSHRSPTKGTSTGMV